MIIIPTYLKTRFKHTDIHVKSVFRFELVRWKFQNTSGVSVPRLANLFYEGNLFEDVSLLPNCNKVLSNRLRL